MTSNDDLTVRRDDGSPDGVEVGQAIEGELGRLVRHPRAEAARLKRVADEGEAGYAPFIEMAFVARWIVPFVAAVIAIVFVIYLKA